MESVQDPAQVLRVRILNGPDESVVGKIGYLFDHSESETGSRAYLMTIVNEDEVRRLYVADGYEFAIEDL